MNPLATFGRWAQSEVLHFAWNRGWYQPPDRKLLEGTILPALANDPGVKAVLFVGVKWYNAGHRDLFEKAGKTFATIDPDPKQSPFGGNPHAVAFVQDLEKHFEGMVFDAIIISGVIGWGINDIPELDRTLKVFARVMSKGGWLVFGLNPLTKNHVEPTDAEASADFEPAILGSLGKSRVDVPLPFKQKLHTYLVWRKK